MRRPFLRGFASRRSASRGLMAGRIASRDPVRRQARGGKRPSRLGRRDRSYAAEAAVAQVLADDPRRAGQQAHEGLALVAERARLPRSRRRPDGRPAFPNRNRGRCDASTQVPGPGLQRLQAFYRREQHSKADREIPESPVFAGNRVCWGPTTCQMGKSGVQLSVIWPTIVSGNTPRDCRQPPRKSARSPRAGTGSRPWGARRSGTRRCDRSSGRRPRTCRSR